MLTKEGDARDPHLDRRLATVLAAIAGALNVAGFHAFGLFSANMTGNVSAFSDHLGLGEMRLAGFFLLIVLLFLGGAMVSTLLVNAGRRRQMVGVYAFSILAEAALLAALVAMDGWLPEADRGSALILGLSFLMGLQNALVTRISNARVRTTHVSGMLTDIGIELALLLESRRGFEPSGEAPAWRTKLRLHGQTVLAFFAGGVIGVFLEQAIGTGLLLVAAAILLGLALRELRQQRRAGRALVDG